MPRDEDRIQRIRQALGDARLDVFICALPINVLLLSGYWPVIGTGVAIASSGGRISLLIPEDEEDLAKRGWADEVQTFHPASLDTIATAARAIHAPLKALRSLNPAPSRVGIEEGETSEPASYAAMHLYGGALKELLKDVFPASAIVNAAELLQRLRGTKTPGETERIGTACAMAGRAFDEGARGLRPGLTEVEGASLFRVPLSAGLPEFPGVERAGGFAWCMSGANAAKAYGAYARSRSKEIVPGDLALVHCNSYADGYWTDITRTYCIGKLDDKKRTMYEAVFAAREAALGAIVPGARAADVDRAARGVLQTRGFGPRFKHPVGHGTGFEAINSHAMPRLHPKSEETVESGMVFNIEPAIYIEGYGGIRHCDMVAATSNGCEVLTPFQSRLEELVLD
ncbi:MAG: M24 family metallopeptidase [Bryobacteraceae bacterium]